MHDWNTENGVPEMVPVTYAVLPRLTLTVCPTDRFKIGLLRVRATLPDTEENQAAAACLLPVLRRGTVSFPTQEQLNRHLDDLYATDCRMSSAEVCNVRSIGFSSDIPESRVLPEGISLLPDVIRLMAELFFAPVNEAGRLLQKYVESERGHLVDAYASLINHPASYAMNRFRAAFARGRGITPPLTEERIRALDERALHRLLDDVRDRAHFQVFYIGQTAAEEITALLRETFAPLLGATPHSDRQIVEVRRIPARQEVLCVEDTLDVGQSHLILGYRTPITVSDPLFYAMMLCNEILGGSPISRLFTRLREERGLCYSVGSEYVIDRGEVIVACGIDRTRREEAEQAIREQIADLKAGAFSDRELEAARALLMGSYRQLTDSTRAMAAFYSIRQLLGLCVTAQDACRAFAEVTREQVIMAAQSLCCDTVYFLCGTAICGDGEEDAQEDLIECAESEVSGDA